MADETEHHENKNAEGKSPRPAGDANGDAVSRNKDDAEGKPKEGFADPLEFLNAELERVEAEKADLQEQMLRMAAEMENLRKRTQKDIADARSYSIASFAREMLAVADNLGRALDAVSDEAREQGDETLKSLVEGVELTSKSMQQALEKSGVRRISPLNEKFDPNFHQAMFEIPDADVPNNTVRQVVQDGYVIGERVLRPAMVGVAKGGPKASAAQNDDKDEEKPQNAEQDSADKG